MVKTFLDLCIAEKNLLHFYSRGLTRLSAGGVRATNDAFGTPRYILNDPFDKSSDRYRSKRPIKEETMDSHPKKMSPSIEDYLRGISKVVTRRSRKINNDDVDDQNKVRQILDDDSIQEGSELQLQALFLCKNAINRKRFIGMRTKEGREQWIQFNWANISLVP
ncbi:hypothetical protein BS78_02G171300 [Paspalum vaginatum]|nr:hypothetical protein BS78_02G171300 [Paspalum vaginatum]